MTFRHAPNSALFNFQQMRFRLSRCDSLDNFRFLIGGQALCPVFDGLILHLANRGFLRGLFGCRSLRSLRFLVGHGQFGLDLVVAVEEGAEPVDRSDVTLLLAVGSAVFRHADQQADNDLTTGRDGFLIAHSGGDTAVVAQLLDDGVVNELGQRDLVLDELYQAIVYSEGLVIPIGLGVSGGTLGGGGLGVVGVGVGVGVGIHGVPLSLA